MIRDKFNNILIPRQEDWGKSRDTLLKCFSVFLGIPRKLLRQQVLEGTPEEFALVHQREGFVGDVPTFCRRIAARYGISVHIFDSRGREYSHSDGAASIYLLQSDEGRFHLLQMKRTVPTVMAPLFDLWNHPEPGKAVKLASLSPPCAPGYNVHSINVADASPNCLYSMIPSGDKLWRHILNEPEQVLYVYINSLLVATQVFHAKTNPYFYIEEGSTISVVITTSGEKAAYALLCESTALLAMEKTLI